MEVCYTQTGIFMGSLGFLSDRQSHLPITPKQRDSESLEVRLTRGEREQGKKEPRYRNPINDEAGT